MFSFEGNYRSKRNQIYDHTQKLTKDVIVQKTREERKQRDDKRRREQAVIKIQAHVRAFLARNVAKQHFLRQLNQAVAELNELTTSRDGKSFVVPDVDYVKKFTRLIQSFNLFYRRQPNSEHLFTVCRHILSDSGQTLIQNWLIDTGTDSIHVFGNTLSILLSYVTNLPDQTKSSDFAVPFRVFEQLFTNSISVHQEAIKSGSIVVDKSNLVWICRYLSRMHYFRKMAHFIDRQLPPTAGYLSDSIELNNTINNYRTFDCVEFLRPVRTRTLINQILLPITCVIKLMKLSDQSNVIQGLYKDTLISALNDLFLSKFDKKFPLSERIIRGVSAEFMNFPDAHQIVLQEYQLIVASFDSQKLSSSSDRISLQPSLNSLHLLLTVVIQNYIVAADSSSTARTDVKAMDDEMNADVGDSPPVVEITPMSVYNQVCWKGTPSEAIVAIRCVAWLLMQSTNEPHIPIARPLNNLKPLEFGNNKDQSLSDNEDDDDDELDVKQIDLLQSQYTPPAAYIPCWGTQLKEIYQALHRSLPALASSAFTTLSSTNNMIDHDHVELIRSSAYLHFYISQLFDLPITSLIRLNSVYSEHAIYVRSLWFLIQNTKLTTGNHCISSERLLFNHLAAGELPTNLGDLQNYLPLIFTFTNCLHHRLLCLSDAEICGHNASLLQQDQLLLLNCNIQSSKSGCGFKTYELLLVGARLRDLMIGLIDLAHPDQLPRTNQLPASDWAGANTDEAMYDHTFPNYKAIMERVEKRVELSSCGHIVDSVQDNIGYSTDDMRLFLHCWSTLFRRTQRLVFQIYDWNRRCKRQTRELNATYLLNTPYESSVSNLFRNNDSEQLQFTNLLQLPVENSMFDQSFWHKENLVDLVNISSQTWLKHQADQSLNLVAIAPFGYYSCLNPDCNQNDSNSLGLSNREIRQLLLLKELPFVTPFEKRIRLFQELMYSKKPRSIYDHLRHHLNRGDISVVVRRSHLYEDAFDKLSKENEPDLRPRLMVSFLNVTGLREAGIDGGGLTREFLSELIWTGFDPTRGFFIYAADKTLYPNPEASKITPDHLKHYYFLGRILAKAIYEDMLVELRFAYFFLAKLVSRSGGAVGFDYLDSLDPQLYKQLLFLKTYEGDVRDLELDFTLTQSAFGETDTVELKPGGKHIPVTSENCVEYVHLVANYKLNKLIYPQVRAFKAGLNDIISIDWLGLFDAEELQTLISGSDREIDVDDLMQHTVYVGDSANYTKTLECFWSVLHNLPEKDKRSFLRFVTACSRPPMFGFRDLIPPFSIQVTNETERLPTASTCMNLLRLPAFQDTDILRDRLLYALNANAGFEYS